MARRILRRMLGRDDGESGGALVELALSLSLFALLMVGAVQLALIAYAAVQVSNAAGAGAQYGAQTGGTAADTTGISSAATYDANMSGLTNFHVTSSYSCVCSDGTASTCQNTDCANSHTESTVTVNTSTTFNPLIHIPGLPGSITLHGQAIQKCGE